MFNHHVLICAMIEVPVTSILLVHVMKDFVVPIALSKYVLLESHGPMKLSELIKHIN